MKKRIDLEKIHVFYEIKLFLNVRCEDVTDVGTHFDTHLCGGGCGGHVLPHHLQTEAIWFCTLCKKVRYEIWLISLLTKSNIINLIYVFLMKIKCVCFNYRVFCRDNRFFFFLNEYKNK